MTTTASLRLDIQVASDIGILWKEAIKRYEADTAIPFQTLAGANNAEAIITEMKKKKMAFKDFRHDGSKLDKFRTLVKKSLERVEKLGDIVAAATKAVIILLIPAFICG